jgi:hypothetical protein
MTGERRTDGSLMCATIRWRFLTIRGEGEGESEGESEDEKRINQSQVEPLLNC